jgi:hypothetical protein
MIDLAIGLIVGSLFGGCVVGLYDVRASRRRLNAIKESCREHREKQQHALNELVARCEKMQKKVDQAMVLSEEMQKKVSQESSL